MSRISWAFSVCAAISTAFAAAFTRADDLGTAVFIAAGSFTMGETEADLDYARRLCVRERVQRGLEARACLHDGAVSAAALTKRVFVPAFRMDRFALSRGEYTDCVARGVCTQPVLPSEHPGLSHPRHPITGVSMRQAEDACADRGGRLPTEAEWERAARGDSQRRFPWGSQFNAAFANAGAQTVGPGQGGVSERDGFPFLAPVDAFAEARSPHGLVQMAGNVWEWTQDAYALDETQARLPDPASSAPPRATDAGEGTGPAVSVVRGGSFLSPAHALRVTHREPRPSSMGYRDVGVRCAYDAPPRTRPNADHL